MNARLNSLHLRFSLVLTGAVIFSLLFGIYVGYGARMLFNPSFRGDEIVKAHGRFGNVTASSRRNR